MSPLRIADFKSALRHRETMTLIVIEILAVTGVALLLIALAGQKTTARPKTPASNGSVTYVKPASPAGTVSAAKPVSLKIPKIGVDTAIISVGKNADGTLKTPAGRDYDKAAWYDSSPPPGQYGASVIEGHVDSAKTGPSVFFNLGSLLPGDSVFVTLANGQAARFMVTAVKEFPKDNFPTQDVYGAADYPALRLITCGGDFNTETGDYDSNVVVFAYLSPQQVQQI
jgi:sortase (surface protein transpeptidase)